MAPRSNSIPLNEPFPQATPPRLSLVGGTNTEQTENNIGVSFEDGAMKIAHPDGSVTIDFNPQPEISEGEKGFSENLALHMSDEKLSSIASDLLEGIQRDEQSRQEWLDTRARGISLLGIKLEQPRTDAGNSSAPLEGMSVVRHPLLIESTVAFQATARAELLPAAGPVKVRNDTPPKPPEVNQQTNAKQELQESLQSIDIEAQALEKDLNHYLTAIATEYIPDTDRMLFYVGFGGDGFKKVYNCPLRRRPVSESIDAEDLIVSNHATDLQNSGRITHRIRMRKSILRRMQIIGAYRDVDLTQPVPLQQNAVDKKKEEVEGIRSNVQRPEDMDYEILEVYCELDLDEFAPNDLKGKGLPLPYRVTIARESREVLDVRRNWKEDDKHCLAKQFFVQFPFIRGLGFYGLGFIHLLGNTANALTAAWREMLDAGMFANFPGFLYAKGAGRQNTNQFRIPPSGGQGLDIGAQQSIRDAVMPLPYKEPGPAFTAFITHIEEVGQRLAATGSITVGEGKQDAPVGTTLALIEQASKVLDSAHKRLHAAQAEEFKLLKERFREDPDAFLRNNKNTSIQWQKDQFVKALDNCSLVPVADPNNPTMLHRIAKATIIKTLQQQSQDLYDPVAVDMRVLSIAGIDPQGLFRPTPAQPPPDPRMEAISAKTRMQEQENAISALETKIKAAQLAAQLADKAKDRESREKIEAMKIELQKLRLEQEKIIHAHDAARDAALAQHEMRKEQFIAAHKVAGDRAEKAHKLQSDAIATQHEMHGGRVKTEHELNMERERHNAEMDRAAEEHRLKMEHMRELHQAKLEAAKQMASVKKTAKPKPKKEKP